MADEKERELNEEELDEVAGGLMGTASANPDGNRKRRPRRKPGDDGTDTSLMGTSTANPDGN